MGVLARLVGRRASANVHEIGPGANPALIPPTGTAPRAGQVAALAMVEAASGLVARALAMADVSGGPIAQALTPAVLEIVGRQLCVVGQSVWLLEMFGDRLMLCPASSWNIEGDSLDPLAWRYTVELSSPTGHQTRRVMGADVLDWRMNPPPQRPWQGRSPLRQAGLTANLAVAAEHSLKIEMQMTRKQALISSAELDSDVREDMEKKLNMQGLDSAYDPAGQQWAVIDGSSDQYDAHGPAFTFMRFGAQPDAGSVKLRETAGMDIASALGVPVELLRGATAAASAREAFRRFYTATLLPMSRLVMAELNLKGMPVKMSYKALAAGDTVSRARSFKSYVDGGMTKEAAAMHVGIDPDEA